MKSSIWTKSAELPRFQRLNGDKKTDVLIIGDGMCGLLCAYYLQQAGTNCILAEGNRIACGITKNTTAKITSQHGLIYAKLIRDINPVSGTTFTFGGCSVQLFCPKYENADDLNNTSIIAKVICGNTSFLFTDDAESNEEHDILSQGYDLSAIDKKTKRSINSSLKRGSEFSDDISAYDLILTNKERLLSFNEPTRFIFSHSALREGWDNPNVFQICTLKHSDSNTAKRQEVGRGLRLCVNQDGGRMDVDALGERIHDINKLTVVASESYQDFVGDLQKDIKSVLYDRPQTATREYFKGKYVKIDGVPTVIDDKTADKIEFYLIKKRLC